MTAEELRTVAVLCCSTNSIYHQIKGVDAFDPTRDARTFGGGMPIVAHPPCRTWSRSMSHYVRITDSEKASEQELGVWCCEQVKEHGGIVEQPAHSRLWDAARLPKPSPRLNGDGFTLHVWQAFWGYPIRKQTWLYFSKINVADVMLPMRLHVPENDGYKFELMSKKERSRTTLEFASWLVGTARLVRI